MPSIKSLTCTLCKIVMEPDIYPFRGEIEELYNMSSRDTVLEEKGVGKTHHQVIIKDLFQSCQVKLYSNFSFLFYNHNPLLMIL